MQTPPQVARSTSSPRFRSDRGHRFDEDPNNRGGFFLRDFRTTLADADFSTVNIEITIGTGPTQDKLTGTANMVEEPAGSGRWRLANGP